MSDIGDFMDTASSIDTSSIFQDAGSVDIPGVTTPGPFVSGPSPSIVPSGNGGLATWANPLISIADTIVRGQNANQQAKTQRAYIDAQGRVMAAQAASPLSSKALLWGGVALAAVFLLKGGTTSGLRPESGSVKLGR